MVALGEGLPAGALELVPVAASAWHGDDLFAALNEAAWNTGVGLVVADGVKLAGPIHVRVHAGTDATMPRIVLTVGRNAEAMLVELEPALDHVIVTRNSSPRSHDPADLGEIAVDVFGEDRVTVVADLPDALDAAVALAEVDGIGGGVVATGSVVTAADVRLLLGVRTT